MHERVAVVGAEVRHAAVGDACMTSAVPPKAASGRPPPMLLAKRDQVGRDAQARGRAVRAGGEAGLDLVEDQQHAVRVAQGADAGEVAGVGQHDADVLEHRLHDHAGDSSPCAASMLRIRPRSL